MTDNETLKGELLFFETRAADGWGIGEVQVEGGSTHRVTGKLVGVKPGEAVELAGSWMDTKYGRQFKVRQCTSSVPQTLAGVVAWMASSLPEVGEKRALEMVRRFGVAGLWEVIETTPHKLCVIDGITPERADKIAIAYEEQRAERDAMIVLRGWGLTDKQIVACVKQWDCAPADVVRTVRGNPYVLMEDVAGFGFTRADEVATRAGIPKDSPLRIAAALGHLVGVEVLKGHCFVPQGKLRVMAEKLLHLPETKICPVMRDLYVTGRLIVRGQRVYRPALDRAEVVCASAIRTLLQLQGAA